MTEWIRTDTTEGRSHEDAMVAKEFLPYRTANEELSAACGREVLMADEIEVKERDLLRFWFREWHPRWRHGIWVGTRGSLEINGEKGPQFVVWTDSAPSVVSVGVVTTDGTVRIHNVWDSGRGLGPYESQRATSGMIVDAGERSSVNVYRCNDIGAEPTFDDLVFEVTKEGG